MHILLWLGSYVYKYDPKTKVNAPLCNKANCLHDKESDKTKIKSCNAYYPYIEEGQISNSIIVYEVGYIYLAGESRDWAGSDRNELWRIKADGSERTLIKSFARPQWNQIIHRGYYYYTEHITMKTEIYSSYSKSLIRLMGMEKKK